MSMITMSKSEQEVRLFTCSLCCEDKPPSSLCLLQKCFHESCKDCLIKWIEKEESSGRSSLPTCPFCRVALTENDTGAILGRPYKPQASSATAPDETQVDDLTLQWLQEHTKLCPRCGARIEKLQGGCDMMECLCGCRFCYGCGSPNAQCPCTPAHHYFWDNITDGRASRSPPAQAVMDEGTGQIDLRAHIIARKQQEGVRKARELCETRRRHEPDNRAGATSQQSKEAMSSTALPSASRPPGSSESEWQKIRHKQQRLLLLRHASRCQHEPGTCPVTPHCASMKKLWEHIAHCKNQQCKVQHCLSSRYVLSHYRRCRNPRCPSCGPVRDSIRRSTEREKNRQPQSMQNQSPVPSFDSDRFAHNDSIAPTNSMSPQPSEPSFEPKAKRPKIEDAHSVGSNTMTAPMSKPAKMDSMKAQTCDHSLLNSFTLGNLETHLHSLGRNEQLPQAKFKSKCMDVLKGLQTHQHGWVFNCPVDPVELGLPDYFDIVKKPMDLGTIQKNLDSGTYRVFKDFEADVNLTFDNAMTYNDNESVVHGIAKELKEKFDADMAKLMAQLEEEDLQRRQNERACTLCGCENLSFEPPVGISDAERLQRQRNLMMHIQLIEHAAGCVSKTCSSSNCAKMKSYLHHASICSVEVQGGCKICKRVWTLFRIHAHKCKKPKCPIPQCMAIKEKMRQLQKQQQAMDDRRRLEMNRHMHYSMAGDAN